ncbi:MAG: [LysW]-aminoadipate kinase [Candidatus Ranarchaeia archaeon]
MRIVVKIGGSIINNDLSALVEDIRKIHENHELIIVHGGAKIVTEISNQLGKPPRFVESPQGFRSRYTDEQTIEIFSMVIAGLINKKLVNLFQKHGIDAIGLSGLDGRLLQGLRKKKLKIRDGKKILLIDGGYTGKINNVRVELIDLLLSNNYTPIIATLALSEDFKPLNIDGDRTAAVIAQQVKADQLISLTDVDGVYDDEKKLISKISLSKLQEEIDRVNLGMKRKLQAIQEAIDGGVKKVSIGSGIVKEPLSKALSGENCTVILNE